MSKKKKGSACIKGLYRKRDKFVFQPPMKNGKRPPAIFLNTTDFAEAVNMADDLAKREMIRSTAEETADLVKEWLAEKAKSRRHKTKVTTESARASLKRFTDRFPTLRSITANNLVAWRDEMAAERKRIRDDSGLEAETDEPALSLASINGYLRYSQSFVSWLEKTGRIHRSPFSQVTDLFPRKIPTRRASHCTKEQRDQLIANCEHLELKAVLFFGFHAGLRRAEILNLRPSWLIRDEAGRPSHIHVRAESGADGTTAFTIKDDEEKVIPMTDPLIDFVISHGIDQRSPYLIAPEIRGGRYKYRWEFKRRWKSYVESQGLPEVTPHTMRHTFVTLLLSAPPEVRPSLLHLERWTGDDVATLKKSYAHLIEDRTLINAAN